MLCQIPVDGKSFLMKKISSSIYIIICLYTSFLSFSTTYHEYKGKTRRKIKKERKMVKNKTINYITIYICSINSLNLYID